jgi:hypothetical protein
MTKGLPKETLIFENRTMQEIYEEVRNLYQRYPQPWVIGYSGGKDSIAVVQLVWKALEGLSPEERQKPVFVIASDTKVETPVIVEYIHNTLHLLNKAAQAQGMPFQADKVMPTLNNSFWVNLIGRGYPAPTSHRLQDALQQMHHGSIVDPFDDFGQEHVMSAVVAIALEVTINDPCLPAHNRLGHALHSGVRRPFRAIAIRALLNIRFKNGRKDQLQGSLHHTVAYGWHPEDADLRPTILRYCFPPHPHGLIRACDQFVPYVLKKRFHPAGLDVCKRHPVN